MKHADMSNTYKRWTTEEDRILINNYTTIGDMVASLLPNRTVKAIRIRAHRLGIKSPNSWTDMEDYIIKFYGISYNDEMAKSLPNRSINSIKLRCYYLKNINRIRYPLNLYIDVYGSDKGYYTGCTFAMFKLNVERIIRSIEFRTDLGNCVEFGRKIATAMELYYKRNIKIDDVACIMNIHFDEAVYLINRGIHLIKCVI